MLTWSEISIQHSDFWTRNSRSSRFWCGLWWNFRTRTFRLHDQLVPDAHLVTRQIIPLLDVFGTRIESRGDAGDSVATFHRVVDRLIDKRGDCSADSSFADCFDPLGVQPAVYMIDQTVESLRVAS